MDVWTGQVRGGDDVETLQLQVGMAPVVLTQQLRLGPWLQTAVFFSPPHHPWAWELSGDRVRSLLPACFWCSGLRKALKLHEMRAFPLLRILRKGGC